MIIKELKHITFSWEQDKILFIHKKLEGHIRDTSIPMSKIEMFSLARFILRIAQHGKTKKKTNESGVSR
mgnify:CR=1 FL=1